jgi:hypothetical protein
MGEEAQRRNEGTDGDEAGAHSHLPEDKDPKFVRYLKVVSATVAALAAIAAAVGALLTNCYKDVHLFENIAADESDAARAATKDPPATRGLPAPSESETLLVPYYGRLAVGGPCDRGEHVLTATWNCDATSKRRVHCQNGMVAVDICPTRCKHEPNGANDLCE